MMLYKRGKTVDAVRLVQFVDILMWKPYNNFVCANIDLEGCGAIENHHQAFGLRKGHGPAPAGAYAAQKTQYFLADLCAADLLLRNVGHSQQDRQEGTGCGDSEG